MKVVGGDALELRLYNKIEQADAAALKFVTTAVDYIKEGVVDKVSGSVLQKKSGRLADSIRGEVILGSGVVIGRVYSDGSVPYFGIQERGGRTRPHEIVAKNAAALRFEMTTVRGPRAVSDIWFAAKVNHPGSRIPAHRVLLNTMREFRQVRDDIFTADFLKKT